MKILNRKKTIYLLLALLMLGIALGKIFKIGFFKVENNSSPRSSDSYYCPMHPQITSDRPGSCPICNMQLVKKDPAPVLSKNRKGAKENICYLHNCPKMHDGKPCPMLAVAQDGEPVQCPLCGGHVSEGKKDKQILYWTDPMIPGYKSEKSGKSPMGMDLIPVYAEEGMVLSSNAPLPQGYATILLTPQRAQIIGLKTAVVTKKSLTKTIRASGTIAHDPELYQAQAEYIQAIQTLARAQSSTVPEIADQAKRMVESSRIRLKHLGLSDDLISEIATWKEPEHGLLFAHSGQPVWMYSKIYEFELPLVKIGQKVLVDIPSLPGKKFTGIVRAIDAMVDPQTRTTRLRAQLQDPDGELKPDMYVNATIVVDLGETIAVKHDAVFNTGNKQIVFVDQGDGVLEPRDVQLGVKTDDEYQILQGLSEGEKVVVSGNFMIDSESRLKAVFEENQKPGDVQPTGEVPHVH